MTDKENTIKINILCPRCSCMIFSLNDSGSYAKCKNCGEEIFIKDSDFELGFVDDRIGLDS